MAIPRFKLDLVLFDDPATLLGLPVSAEPSSVTLQQHDNAEADEQMHQDLQLLEQLNVVLTTTDISYVQPVNSVVVSTSNPSSRLAKSLVSRNPLLFQYGVAEVDAADEAGAVPSRQTAMAVSAHTSQLDPPGSAMPSRAANGTPGSAQIDRSRAANGPAAKKRARRAVRPEAYVMMNDEAKAAAAKLSLFLETCIAAASSRPPDGYSDDEDGKDGIERKSMDGSGRRRCILNLDVLQNLHGELLTAQAQGYLQLIPHALLQQLLMALHGTAELGRNRLLSDGTELKSAVFARVTTALEAMLCELVVYATPKLPPSLYLEELLGCAVELTTYHLQSNVLPVHDLRFKRLYQPDKGDKDGQDEDDEDEPVKPAKTPRGRGVVPSMSGRYAPRWTSVVVGQLEQALSLLSQVMALVRMDAERLIPLVRMSQLTLTVSSLQTLHYRALGLAVSMFKHYPLHRETVLGQLVDGLLTHMGACKHLARCFSLQTSDHTTNIQMSTALVMQLVQVTAELPKVDSPGPDPLLPARMPASWADAFWRAIFNKLPTSRAPKADAPADIKTWVEALVEDLLVALPLPEWPAATLLLRRLVYIIRKDQLASGMGVQLVCIELLGLVARRLYLLAREAETPEAVRAVTVAVDDAVAAFQEEVREGPVDKSEVAQELLLEHLAVEGGAAGCGQDAVNSSGAAEAETSIAGSARRMIVCNMLLSHDKEVERQQGHKLDEKQVEDSVLHYRQIYERRRSCLGASTSGLPELDRVTAVALSRWLVAKSVLGCSRSRLLSWLADVGGSGRSQKEAYAAAARAKSIKLLGGAIEVDVRVLSLPEVQVGMKGALHDDSVLVREAALDLIGKHISRSTDLASQFYDVLAHAATDTGLTVRKRAVRLLWECCVRCPEFARRNDALLLIVSRATDVEDTMRALVNKICAEIWFLPHFQLESDGGTSQISRGAEQRATQLGELVIAVYSRMGSAISVPFHSTMPIVVTIRSIVGEDGKLEYATVRRGAREVADALLARALELQGEQDAPSQPGPSGRREAPTPSDELFQCLLALHAMCVADAKLLHRPEDPQRVIRCLAPYMKELPSGSNDQAGRRKAEQLLAVLAVVSGCLGSLRHMDDALANEIVQDLRSIISKVSHVQAVTVACQCLCSMASLKPQHQETVRREALTYFKYLDNDAQNKVTGSPEKQRMYPRVLYILGTLCRYGANILDDAPEGSPQTTCASTLDLALQLYNLMDDNLRVKETVLQVLGFIFIARPQLAVNVRDVGPVLERALDRSQPPSLKARCLISLTELLRSEEDVLLARQDAARREAAVAQQASTLPDAETRELARRNGEGDSSSVSSGIVQMLWEKILALATDTTPAPTPAASGQTPPPTPSGTAAAHGAVVRRRALELIEVVIRAGIVVPWTAMPALCALATDPERDTAARALEGLRSMVTANTTFVAGQVPRGVAEAYTFHCRLWSLERPGQALSPDKCRPLVDGLSAVWASIFQPNKTLKATFLTALLKPLDEGCTLAAGSAAKSDTHLLSFMAYVIAELEYRRMDELLAVLVRVNEIVRRRAHEVLEWFQKLRETARARKEEADKDGRQASSAPAQSATPPGTPPSLAGVVKAALALSLLLWLKQYLRISYDVTAERVDKYEPPGPHRKEEEKRGAVHNRKLRFNASKLPINVAARVGGHAVPAGAGASATAMKAAAGLAAAGGGTVGGGTVSVLDPGVEEVYKVFKALMKQDDGECKQGAHAVPTDVEPPCGSSPGANDLRGIAINLEEIMAAPESTVGGAKKPPLSRARGRGSRDQGAPRSRESTGLGRGRPPSGSGRASTASKRAKKRKRIGSDSEDSDGSQDGDGDAGDAEEGDVRRKPPATKRSKRCDMRQGRMAGASRVTEV